MARTAATLIEDISRRAWDPNKIRYPSAELLSMLNYVLDEIQLVTPFQKKNAIVSAGSYVLVKNSLKYYAFPSEFVGIDETTGIMVDGIRYTGTTDAEVDLFQDKALVAASEGETIEAGDYFDLEPTGKIAHYFIDGGIENESVAGRSGFWFWLMPAPDDSQTIKYTYYMLPTQYTSGGTEVSRLVRLAEETVVYGVLLRVMEKALAGKMVDRGTVIYYKERYDEKRIEVENFYNRIKSPDEILRVKTARQAYGMYRSNTGPYPGFNDD